MGKRIALILLAIIVGEAALVLLTTLAQEVLFNGIDYYTSTLSDLVLGGLATVLAAVLSGAIATVLTRGGSYLPPLVISMIIVLETSYLIATGLLNSPLWFDVLSGLSLIGGIWLGYFAIMRSAYVKGRK